MCDFEKTVAFLRSIGLSVEEGAVDDEFLPGICIAGGKIVYVRSIATAGDLLHEAGHIAVTPAIFRDKLTANTDDLRAHFDGWLQDHPNCMAHPENPVARAILQAGECEATAWSYAAALAAGVDTMLPFKVGYDGMGRDQQLRLSIGKHAGIHGLAHAGMTVLPNYMRKPEMCFPRMERWLQA